MASVFAEASIVLCYTEEQETLFNSTSTYIPAFIAPIKAQLCFNATTRAVRQEIYSKCPTSISCIVWLISNRVSRQREINMSHPHRPKVNDPEATPETYEYLHLQISPPTSVHHILLLLLNLKTHFPPC